MATTGVINATDINFYFNGTKLASAENGDISVTREMRDAFSKDSGDYDEVAAGKISWNGSGSCKFRFDETNFGPRDVLTVLLSGVDVTVTFSTETAGDFRLSGSGKFTEFKNGGNAAESMVYNWSMKGNGVVEVGDIS